MHATAPRVHALPRPLKDESNVRSEVKPEESLVVFGLAQSAGGTHGRAVREVNERYDTFYVITLLRYYVHYVITLPE